MLNDICVAPIIKIESNCGEVIQGIGMYSIAPDATKRSRTANPPLCKENSIISSFYYLRS